MNSRPLPYPNTILFNGKIRTFQTETLDLRSARLLGIAHCRHRETR